MFGMRWFPGGMGLFRVSEYGARRWRPAATYGREQGGRSDAVQMRLDTYAKPLTIEEVAAPTQPSEEAR